MTSKELIELVDGTLPNVVMLAPLQHHEREFIEHLNSHVVPRFRELGATEEQVNHMIYTKTASFLLVRGLTFVESA